MNNYKYIQYLKRILNSIFVKISPKKTRIYIVGKEKQYDTLKECIDEATKYMDSIVYVHDGIYDLYKEFGKRYFDNINKYSSNRSGMILKNGIHVIFSNNSKVIFHYKGDNEYVKTKFSPFNTGDFGFKLENANIECSNCRYCVHDEMHASLFQYKNKYISCNMKMDNSNNTDWNSYQCIGGGLGLNGEIFITNSKFNTVTKVNYPAVSWHNRGGKMPSRSKICISNCKFGERNTFRLNSYGKFKDMTTAILTHNIFGALVINEKTTKDSCKNTEIIEFDNEYITI